jgi:hypothetical protein
MVLVGGGGVAMCDRERDDQLSVPDRLRGRVMSVYTTVFAGSVPIGGLLMGALASSVGIPLAIGIGGALSLATGFVALAWWRRIAPGWTGSRVVSGPGGDRVALDQPAPSGRPNTSAAFSPPKPNEVLNTRR